MIDTSHVKYIFIYLHAKRRYIKIVGTMYIDLHLFKKIWSNEPKNAQLIQKATNLATLRRVTRPNKGEGKSAQHVGHFLCDYLVFIINCPTIIDGTELKLH